MLSLYNAMALEQPRLDRFLARIDDAVVKIAYSRPAGVRLPSRYLL